MCVFLLFFIIFEFCLLIIFGEWTKSPISPHLNLYIYISIIILYIYNLLKFIIIIKLIFIKKRMSKEKNVCYICMDTLKEPIYPSGCDHGICRKHLKIIYY